MKKEKINARVVLKNRDSAVEYYDIYKVSSDNMFLEIVLDKDIIHKYPTSNVIRVEIFK